MQVRFMERWRCPPSLQGFTLLCAHKYPIHNQKASFCQDEPRKDVFDLLGGHLGANKMTNEKESFEQPILI